LDGGRGSLEPALRIRLFGGVRATGGDGAAVDVGPAKCQALLAALALTPGDAVPVWRLVELIWDAAPPRTAERTLQSYATRLRKALGADAVVRTGVAYRLDVPADAVDVARFERALDAGDVQTALSEWAGEPLAGLDAPGLAPAADALVERWLGAVEADLERMVERDAPAAIGRLTELTARHPFREGLWAVLMTALYRVGRQADALAAYRTARARLVDELGVEPGPRLRELERLVLSHDERLQARKGHLPHPAGRLIGRDADVASVEHALAAHAVITLVGPGGIGKTRLALEAARRSELEVCLVELAEVSSPADVPRAVADAAAVKDSSGRTLVESIVAAFESRAALLVLDNCEHVIDGAARLADAVAERCPDVHVLATSREALRIAGERVIAVGPLEPSGPAVELFRERAGRAGDAEAVEAICRALDGVPLAIELAAARTRSLTPAELLERLDRALALLTGGPRTGGGRRRTLRATIQWSYDLLEADEQVLLARLSVFAGPFDLAAAEAVAGDAGALVGDLADRSLVLIERGRFGRRFRLLDTVRQFAAEHLDSDAAAARHATWCLREVTRIGELLAGPSELEGVARLEELWPNLRAAFGRACAAGDRGLAQALVRPIAPEVLLRSRHEIGDWAERILAITPPGDERSRVFGLVWAAHRYAIAHDPEGYARLAERYGEPDHPLVRHARAFALEDYEALARHAPEAVAEHRRNGDHDLAEHAEIDIGGALLNLGRLAEHDAVVSELAERYRANGPPTLLNWTLMLLGYSALFQGERARADELFDAAVTVELPERTHSPNGPIEARATFRRGERQRAYRTLRAHVDELLATANMQGASIACLELVNMLAALDRPRDAARLRGYLEASGLLGAPGFRALLSETASRVAPDDHGLDDRAALAEMRRLLDDLVTAGRCG
jgi:predicted ATPase/DNA-binding SARP family transcriptional activator